MFAEVFDVFGSGFFAIPDTLLSVISRIFDPFIVVQFHNSSPLKHYITNIHHIQHIFKENLTKI